MKSLISRKHKKLITACYQCNFIYQCERKLLFGKLGFYGEIVVLYYKIVDQWLNFSFFIAGEQEFIALSRRIMM